MEITPIAQHVELLPYETNPAHPYPTPGGELIVSAPVQEWPDDNGPRGLREVRPAAIAIQGQLCGRHWGPGGLRIGMLLINQIQVAFLPSLAVRVDVIGCTYINQLSDYGDVEEEIGPATTVFSGGAVYWGDNDGSAFTSPFDPVEHTYDAPGTYDVTLSLDFAELPNFAWSGRPTATRRITIS